MKKNLLTISGLSRDDITDIFKKASQIKKDPFSGRNTLKDKVIGLIFQKPSNRTRVSFEVGTLQLGGHSVYLGPDDIKFGERESINDIARVLSRYLELIVLRTFKHSDILEFAKYAEIPVINGLSELVHPCQALADVFTMKEKLADIKGKTLCFVGDGNNVLHSLLSCCSKVGMNVRVATPKGYGPNNEILKNAKLTAKKMGAIIEVGNDPKEAAKDADVIYTDVWVSMGQESEKDIKIKTFKGFQVNSKLVGLAKKEVLVMHCLPAHREEEITDDVIESKLSIVFDQAENRLHTQKAIIMKLMGD